MAERKVYLDDVRPTPDGWERAYWPEGVISKMKEGDVTVISLDHDLGDDERGTGYDVLLWIEEAVATSDFKPPIIYIHTANPAADRRMRYASRMIRKRYWEKHGVRLQKGS